MTSVGKYLNLTQCSDEYGTMSVLAIDHQGPNEIQKQGKGPGTYAEVLAFKARVIRYLGAHASALLVDPDFALPTLVSGDLPGTVGLIGPLELTNYGLTVGDRGMDLIPDWDLEKLQLTGYNGAKLNMTFREDAPNAAEKVAFVDALVERCDKAQVPFFLEPLCYSLDPAKPLTNAERRDIIIGNAAFFTSRGVDVLKMEFPLDCNQEGDRDLWRAAARDLDAVCTVPWTLLSAGVSYELFEEQAAIVCAAGASGVIAGRAIWGDALHLDSAAQEHWLATEGRARMARITAICRGMGRSWKDRTPAPDMGKGWYAAL